MGLVDVVFYTYELEVVFIIIGLRSQISILEKENYRTRYR